MDIRQRYFEVPRTVMRKLGHQSFVIAGYGKSQLLNRIEDIFRKIYNKHDLSAQDHVGIFMYRDTFAKIRTPIIYGKISINPFDFVELTEIQKRIIQTEPEQISMYLDQFIDVTDIHYGIRELNKCYSDIELVRRYLNLSRLHLHGAAAVLTAGYDHRSAIQSSLLATELALKAALAALGKSENQIRNKYGHDTLRACKFLEDNWENFDISRASYVLSTQPKYTDIRYSALNLLESK